MHPVHLMLQANCFADPQFPQNPAVMQLSPQGRGRRAHLQRPLPSSPHSYCHSRQRPSFFLATVQLPFPPIRGLSEHPMKARPLVGPFQVHTKTQRSGCQAPETPSVQGSPSGLTTRRFSQTWRSHDATTVKAVVDVPAEEVKATSGAICLQTHAGHKRPGPMGRKHQNWFDLQSRLNMLFREGKNMALEHHSIHPWAGAILSHVCE